MLRCQLDGKLDSLELFLGVSFITISDGVEGLVVWLKKNVKFS